MLLIKNLHYDKLKLFLIYLSIFLIGLITNTTIVKADSSDTEVPQSLNLNSNLSDNSNDIAVSQPYKSDLLNQINGSGEFDLKNKQINATLKSLRAQSTSSVPVLNTEGSSVTVNSWQDFIDAAGDTSVGKIVIGVDLKAANNKVSFQNDKVVAFNGHSIDMASRYMNTNNYQINFVDASINSTGSAMLRSSSNAVIIFSGIGSLTGTILDTNNIYTNLNFTNANYVTQNTSSTPTIRFQGSSGGDLSIKDSTITDSSRSFYYSSTSDSISKNINIDNSTIKSTYPSGTSNYFISTYGTYAQTGMILKITNNSNVNVDKTNQGDFNAPIYLFGTNTKIILSTNSKFTVNNPNGAAITESGVGSIFDVSDEGTELNVSRSGTADYNNAVIRFAWTGEMTFDIKNHAKVSINQNGTVNTYGIRMYGGGNNISVSNGAEFDCINNSTSWGPGIGDNDGQGIYYAGGGSSNSFKLSGTDSQVLISANNGPAISSLSRIDMTAGDGTSFVARGYYPGNAIFYSTNILNFNMGVPRYFDFMNTASIGTGTGGTLFNCSDTSQFSHGNIPLSVWLSTSNVQKSPTKSWKYVNATYSGVNFNKFTTTSSDADFKEFLVNNSGLSKLGRMTANTAPAQVKNAPDQPTNADSYVWVPTLMPAENNAYRPSYDNEVYAEVQLTYPDGTTKTATGTSVQNQKYYEYSTSTIDGAIKIPISSLGSSKKYLEPGTKIKILKLWRNDPDYNSINAIKTDMSNTKYNQYKEQTVIDKTPPDPVVIKNNVKMISQWSKKLEGTGEPGTSLSWKIVHHNGSADTVYPNATTVDSNGNWKINNISGIVNDDKIIVYLTDKDANTTPFSETIFHDATFLPATVVSVGGTNTLSLDVTENLDFGIIPAYTPVIKSPASKEFNVAVNDDRDPSHVNGWKLMARASNFKSGQREISSDDLGLELNGNNNIINITNTDSLIREQQITDDYRGSTILDLINGPQKIKLRSNGVDYPGKYTSTVTWTATDSL